MDFNGPTQMWMIKHMPRVFAELGPQRGADMGKEGDLSGCILNYSSSLIIRGDLVGMAGSVGGARYTAWTVPLILDNYTTSFSISPP